MNDLKIIEIISEQLDTYRVFLNTGLVEDEESFRITLKDDADAPFPTLGQKDSFTLGAYYNNELAGVVSFKREGDNREKLRHKGLLFRMYVAKKYRGKGVAKKLIEELIFRVKALGDIEQVNLTVITNNAKAKALYEGLGFKTYGSEQKAIKWKNKYFSEDFMVLFLK